MSKKKKEETFDTLVDIQPEAKEIKELSEMKIVKEKKQKEIEVEVYHISKGKLFLMDKFGNEFRKPASEYPKARKGDKIKI